MPFDANLVLANDDGDWTAANLTSYGTPTSATRNAGGFAVIDLGSANIGGPVKGLAAVLILLDSAGAADDALTCIIEESATVAFTVPFELCKFDILAATKGVIIGSEQPATVVRRISPRLRFVRAKATNVALDNQGTVWCLLSPYPYKVL